MARSADRRIEALLERCEWEHARPLLEQALAKRPDDHWLLTQVGVTDYEQGRYRESVRRFLSSLQIVPDCPLTLWNLAGALDAIGKPEKAIPIYTWLLESDRTPEDDPCWESVEWTDALKTDCVFRMGVCFEHMKQWESSEHCFLQYVNLLLGGMRGAYPIEEAANRVREVSPPQTSEARVRDAIASTLRKASPGSRSRSRRLRHEPPELSAEELLTT